ncbi:MAG: FAD-binding protein, partial [Ottowia sp.]|nr:FAD-binding protein [Ottowia sp.]
MFIERNVSLQPLNSFGIAARAALLTRVRGEADVRAVLADAELAPAPKFVLGGGSNIVLTGDVKAAVLKVEVPGRRVVGETARHTIVEAGAGENWHDFVTWTLDQGLPGLENLALIPGTVGASPVQNIGAYGVELQDRFHALDAIDLLTGEVFTLDAAQCGFGYRDSVFKHVPAQPGDFGLAGRALILRVRFALPKQWQPVLGYLDIERRMAEEGVTAPSARQLYDWIVAIRRAKL